MSQAVREAVAQWEPRVDVEDVRRRRRTTDDAFARA